MREERSNRIVGKRCILFVCLSWPATSMAFVSFRMRFRMLSMRARAGDDTSSESEAMPLAPSSSRIIESDDRIKVSERDARRFSWAKFDDGVDTPASPSPADGGRPVAAELASDPTPVWRTPELDVSVAGLSSRADSA